LRRLSLPTGRRIMFESLDIRHWFIIAVLILINVVIFGCMILLLAQRMVLPIG
jgi:hypothetical protein